MQDTKDNRLELEAIIEHQTKQIAYLNNALIDSKYVYQQLELSNYELNKSYQQINNLLENVNEAVAILDEHLNFTVFNPSFIKKISIIFSTHITKNMNFYTLISEFDEYKSQLIHGCQQALSGIEFSFLIENRSKFVEVNYSYELKFKPFNGQANEKKDILFFIRNVTEYKRQEHLRLIQQAKIAQKARLSIMGGMISALAHEISQPLTVILAYSRACLLKLKETKDDKLSIPIEQISIQAEHACVVLKKMKSFMQDGTLHQELTNINILIQESLVYLRYELQESKLNININLNLDEDIPLILLDKIQITQVMLNLVRNSIEALEESANARIDIETKIQKNDVIVSIQDNGPGISQKYASKILKSYFTTKKQGTGLGLRICRSLIDAHGGKLWFKQGKKVGVKFLFSLPLSSTQ